MAKTLKQLTDFLIEQGIDRVEHTNKTYLAHLIGVYRDIESWGGSNELACAGMFHSIYGTELFQGFKLALERRAEVRGLIGERAERLGYLNCAMDRASFDQAVTRATPPHRIVDRLTGQEVELSAADFDDLCRIHLCDWLEQVERSAKWDYRREAYRGMAERLGGVAHDSWQSVYGRAAAAARA
jgi:hypothetical protein